ncbi:MAG: DNA methyltransferase [bacterium]
MTTYLFQLGHNPELAQLELQQFSLTGKQISDSWLQLKQDIVEDEQTLVALLPHLGGTVRIAKMIGSQIPRSGSLHDNAEALRKQVATYIKEHCTSIEERKVSIGFSAFGKPKEQHFFTRLAHDIERDTNARLVRNGKTLTLSTIDAAKLVAQKKGEIVLISTPTGFAMGITIAVQDSKAYQQRDIGRPNVLKRTGLLSPKLAQSLINLAGGYKKIKVIVDPFSGSGTILQEAALQGIKAYGIDIDPRTVKLAQENLQWLKKNYHPQFPQFSLANAVIKHGNATDANVYKSFSTTIDAIITEGELGDNFSRVPDDFRLQKETATLRTLYEKSFLAFAKALSPKGRAVVCFPFWIQYDETVRARLFPLIEKTIKSLGFKHIRHGQEGTILYRRSNQFVGREIGVFEKV